MCVLGGATEKAGMTKRGRGRKVNEAWWYGIKHKLILFLAFQALAPQKFNYHILSLFNGTQMVFLC